MKWRPGRRETTAEREARGSREAEAGRAYQEQIMDGYRAQWAQEAADRQAQAAGGPGIHHSGPEDITVTDADLSVPMDPASRAAMDVQLQAGRGLGASPDANNGIIRTGTGEVHIRDSVIGGEYYADYHDPSPGAGAEPVADLEAGS